VAFAIEYADALDGTFWHFLQEVSAAPTNRLIQITVPLVGPSRFYRLRAPADSAPGGLRIKSIQPQVKRVYGARL
jgi:hypothetical protein